MTPTASTWPGDLTLKMTPTRADLRWLVRSNLRTTTRLLVAYGTVFLLATFILFFIGVRGAELVVLCVGGLLLLTTPIILIARGLEDVPSSAAAPLVCELSLDSLRFIEATKTTEYAWAGFAQVVPGRRMWLLVRSDEAGVALPGHLLSRGEQEHLRAILAWHRIPVRH